MLGDLGHGGGKGKAGSGMEGDESEGGREEGAECGGGGAMRIRGRRRKVEGARGHREGEGGREKRNGPQGERGLPGWNLRRGEGKGRGIGAEKRRLKAHGEGGRAGIGGGVSRWKR